MAYGYMPLPLLADDDEIVPSPYSIVIMDSKLFNDSTKQCKNLWFNSNMEKSLQVT